MLRRFFAFFLTVIFAFSVYSQTSATGTDEMMNFVQDICWSPDGTMIYFSAMRVKKDFSDFKPDKWGVYRYDLKSKKLEKIVDSAFNVTVSPDGRHIVYYFEKGDGQDQLFVMKADGSDAKNITKDEFNNIFPAWFGKNKIIYGQGKKGSPTKVFTINMDGSGKKQLLTLESFYARFSPDGTRIAYIDEKDKSIRIVSPDGKEIEKIVPEI